MLLWNDTPQKPRLAFQQWPWLIGTLLATLVLIGLYAAAARGRPDLPGGSSPVGFGYGVLGFAIILFETALWLKKRYLRTARIGSAQTWMRLHIWLGLLSLPLIVMHGGWQFGGPLTTVLMGVFLLVIVSGVVGLMLQQVLPRLMLEWVPDETIHNQIEGVLHRQVKEFEAKRVALNPPVPLLDDFYQKLAGPFLNDETAGRPLCRRTFSAGQFSQLKAKVPAAALPCVEHLERLCEQKRQLRVQRRLHIALHGWLLVHLPLTAALLMLAGIHVLTALKYW